MSAPQSTVLITGGTGTFGHACTAWFQRHNPRVRLRIFSRDEYKQAQMRQRFGERSVSYLLGDVRQRSRLRLAMRGVDLVIHAAALKHVPAGEYNPLDVMQTNILGTRNVLQAALDCGVSTTVLLSSDKAVLPINTYGFSKAFAERLTVSWNHYAASEATRFLVVRYGNVIGSRGSALELFRHCLEIGAPLPLTDVGMTRFWLSIDEAVALVHLAVHCGARGETWIPRLPAFHLTDLARVLLEVPAGADLPADRVTWQGIRPGEKRHECLMTLEEQARSLFLPNGGRLGAYVLRPLVRHWADEPRPALGDITGALELYEPRPYDSETWPWRLPMADIAQRLKALEETP